MTSLYLLGPIFLFFRSRIEVRDGWEKTDYCERPLKHILIECVDFMEVHQNYFDVPDLKTLFKDVDPSQIFAFLKEIGLFKKF